MAPEWKKEEVYYIFTGLEDILVLNAMLYKLIWSELIRVISL